MKKLLCILLSMVMLFGTLAGCTSTAKTPESEAPTQSVAEPPDKPVDESPDASVAKTPDKVKIGVIFNNMNAATTSVMSYFEDYLGPELNVEFIFSELITGADDAVKFIESCYAAGAQGIIDYTGNSIGIASACADLGMYWISNASYVESSLESIPFYLGSVGIKAEMTKQAYVDIMKRFISDGENHNVLILSGNAPRKGSDHENIVVAVLSALQDTYDLTYDDIYAIANTDTELTVNSGDIKITLLPGFPYSDAFFVSLATLLQSGDYDILVCAWDGISEFANIVSETEAARGIDIKITHNGGAADAIYELFNMKDALGNYFLNSATIRATNLHAGIMFAVLYNGITGYAEKVRVNGVATQYYFPSWVCFDTADYNAISVVDNAPGNYVLGIDEMKELLFFYNEDQTYEGFQAFLDAQTVENIKK